MVLRSKGTVLSFSLNNNMKYSYHTIEILIIIFLLKFSLKNSQEIIA